MQNVLVTCLKDLSFSKKLALSIAIFLFPILLLAYFLVTEKDDLIAFTRQEIAGVNYLRAASEAAGALAAADSTHETLSKVKSALQRAEQNDAGALGVTQASQGLIAALDGKDPGDALAKAIGMISSISDTSNITLDPDTDAYFIGDIIVNQSTGILQQTYNLIGAAHDLNDDKVKSDEHKIAYAEARDGVAGSAANLATDLGKAIKGNADGSVKENLETGGKAVVDAVDQLVSAAKSEDRQALASAAAQVIKIVPAFSAKNSDEMEHLLTKRIEGFHGVLYMRLLITLLSTLLGGFVSWSVVRSITRPLDHITDLMGKLTAGDLNVDIPQDHRTDEIGHLILALHAFQDATRAREKARLEEHARNEKELARAALIKELNTTFKDSVHAALNHLKKAVEDLSATSNVMAEDSEISSKQLAAVAAASQEASSNVQTVAAASEELSASIKEIARQIGHSGNVATQAMEEAKKTRVVVADLSEATLKIGDVAGLISQIASQTNLLALNATIEAARAGEAGKGFAVVASEVKALANQTSKATEDITGYISSIQDCVKNVTAAIQNIDKTIETISEISTTISVAVDEQDAATIEISANVLQASRGTTDVTEHINQITETLSGTEKASHQVLTSAKQLDAEALRLGEDVDFYLANIQSA